MFYTFDYIFIYLKALQVRMTQEQYILELSNSTRGTRSESNIPHSPGQEFPRQAPTDQL